MMRANIIIYPTCPYNNALLQRLLRAGDDGVNAYEYRNNIEAISLGFLLIHSAKDKAGVLSPLKQVLAAALDHSHVLVP
jgi:hypothetical protein